MKQPLSPQWGVVFAFGCQNKVEQKRKPATTTEYFKKPFRVELYKQHLIGQHSAKWKEYCEFPLDRNNAFFEVVPIGSTLHSHFASASDQLFFVIDPSIVDVIIGDLLINEKEENTSVESVFSVFDFVRSEGGCVLFYWAHIKNFKLFKFVIGTVDLDTPFRLASRQMLCAREKCPLDTLVDVKSPKCQGLYELLLLPVSRSSEKLCLLSRRSSWNLIHQR